ncbi:MAG: DUF465 domain-containing protein [Desulfobacca sp.]|uniref:DUF465 domain-containing protein n=1 Tax=Desulfobacca sp. TaxID=2067990 RepID=UPI00404AA65A
MEKADEELVARWIDKDPELKRHIDEHREFERQLEEFNRRPYLTAEETVERRRIQKLKLAGRDRIEQILAQYRAKEQSA